MRKQFEGIEANTPEIPERMNIFSRIGNLLFTPSKLFSFIRKKPTILLPIILVCIGAILVQFLLMEPSRDYMLDFTYNQYKSMGIGLSSQAIEQFVDSTLKISAFASPIMYIIIWIAITLILYLVFRLVKCEKGLRKYFSLVAYIMLIITAGQLVQAVFINVTACDINSPVVTSLASLLDPGVKGTFLYGIASSFEVFNIWAFVLIAVGFVYTGGVVKKKSYILTAILFVVVLLASGAIASVTGAVQSSIQGNPMGSFMGF